MSNFARVVGPNRVLLYAGSDYQKHAKAEIARLTGWTAQSPVAAPSAGGY